MKNKSNREQDRGVVKTGSSISNKAYVKTIPAFWKSFILNFWFAGALFFFFMMSEFSLMINEIDIVVAYGLALGLAVSVVDYVMRSCENGDGKHKKYVLFNSKKWLHFILNVIYGVCCAILIMFVYAIINKLIIQIGGFNEKHIGLPAEPVGVGIIFFIIHLAFVNLKILFKKIIRYKPKDSEYISDDDVILRETEN